MVSREQVPDSRLQTGADEDVGAPGADQRFRTDSYTSSAFSAMDAGGEAGGVDDGALAFFCRMDNNNHRCKQV